MLDSIPTEVFIHVFSFLNQSDKANSMLVSQKWCNIIRDSILLNDIVIQQKYFSTVTEMVKSGSIDGAKVKKLTLKNQDYSLPLYTKLHTAFPKVQNLVWYQPYWSSFSLTVPSPEKTKCKNDLISIEITGFEKCIYHLLQNTTFTKLTAITLHLYKTNDNTPSSQHKIANLLSMPLLKKIDLSGFRLDVHQLEKLHTLLPKLSRIDLSHVFFESTLGHNLPKAQIVSASGVKSFKVNGKSKIQENDLTWIEYFSKKYSNVCEFELDCYIPFCDDIYPEHEHFQACQIMHSRLLSHFTPNLKIYSVPNKLIDENVFNYLDKRNIQLTGLKFKYNDHGVYAFQNSEQIKFVKDVEIANCTSDIALNGIKSLKKLTLNCDLDINNATFYLNKLLCDCHIDHLNIQAPHVSLSHSITSSFINIQNLVLRTHTIDNSVWSWISRYCPLLKNMELYLTSNMSPDNTVMYINLPTHSLDRLSIKVKKGCSLYKLITKNNIRWFELKFESDRSKIVTEIPDCEYEWLEEQYFASIHCRFILHFSIDLF